MNTTNKISPIPFYLVTGFLGSGKTTFLKRFLDTFAGKQRIGVIQNEFASGQVDGKELRRTGHSFELLEVNKGSVFCVCLLSDFRKSLRDFVDQIQPDVIILEATGLADPIAIGELLEDSALKERLYLARVWCVVDSLNFLKMEKSMTRMRHQVRIADTVILNKTDIEGTDINALKKRVSALNPFAIIRKTSYCKVNFTNELTDSIDEPFVQRQIANGVPAESEGRPEMGAKVIRTTRQAKKTDIAETLGQLAINLYRMKGYVRLDNGSVIAVQSCFGDLELTDVKDYEGPSELILMGPDLENQAELYRSIFN